VSRNVPVNSEPQKYGQNVSVRPPFSIRTNRVNTAAPACDLPSRISYCSMTRGQDLSNYSFPTLMPMELVTAIRIGKLRNAFIQLTGTDPSGDCRASHPENYSQVRGKQIR
jgi:hypothetical protein